MNLYASTSTLNARSLNEVPKKNATPCASCRYHHKRCEGGYPCNRCKPDRHKSNICFASTRPTYTSGDTTTGDEGPDDQAVNLQLPNTLQNHQPIAQPSSYNIAPSNIATSAYPMAPQQTTPAQPYGYAPSFSNGQSYPAGYMPYMGGTTGFPAHSNDVVTTTNYNGQFPPSAPNDYQNYMSGNPTAQYYMPQGP